MRITIALVLSLLALAGGACGGAGTDAEDEREEAQASAGEAVREVEEVRALLARALERYRAGDQEEAERLVGDAYLEHFEHVEGPLGERDHELMEELEVLISTTIREKIKQGAPPEEVERLVTEANEKLDEAERVLREET